jgi:hypothetical protein
MMDIDDGYVLWTGIWKGNLYSELACLVCLNIYPLFSAALGNSKADIVKMVDSQPDLAPVIRRVRGGYLKIQGTWMPYEVALKLARRCVQVPASLSTWLWHVRLGSRWSHFSELFLTAGGGTPVHMGACVHNCGGGFEPLCSLLYPSPAPSDFLNISHVELAFSRPGPRQRLDTKAS